MTQPSWVVLIVCALAATARADSKAATKAADRWVAAVVADKPVAVSKAKPVAFWSEVPATTACNRGTLKTPDDMKALGKCLRELAKRFGVETGFGTGTVVKLAVATADLDAAEKKAIERAAKGTTVIAYYGNGDGETLSLFVAVAKDGAVKVVVANAEAAE